MCIAIYKPSNVVLLPETLDNCWKANPDGAGFMFAEEDKLVIKKGYMSYASFLEAYKEHEKKQVVLHFRIRTHGEADTVNTHPFSITDDLGLVHNGVITKVLCDLNTSMSDTWHFVEKIMKSLHPLWKTTAFKTLVESYIGNSKLILLNNKGDYEIYADNLGIWQDDCWFSNSSYKTPKVAKWSSLVPPQKKQPTTKITTTKKQSLTVGSTVTLLKDTPVNEPDYEGESLLTNTKVEIIFFGQQGTIGIKHAASQKTANLYLWEVLQEDPIWPKPTPYITNQTQSKFNFLEEVILKEDYVGVRAGTVLIVTQAGKHYCTCEEPISSYELPFLVPTNLLSSIPPYFSKGISC